MGSRIGDGDPQVMDAESIVLFADDFGQYPVEEWHESANWVVDGSWIGPWYLSLADGFLSVRDPDRYHGCMSWHVSEAAGSRMMGTEEP